MPWLTKVKYMMTLLSKVIILQGLLIAPQYAWCEESDQFPSSDPKDIITKPFAQELEQFWAEQ